MSARDPWPTGMLQFFEIFSASSHYLLHCSKYSNKRLALLNTIKNLDMSILKKVIRNLLAFYFSATLLLTITKILLSSMSL